MHSTTGLSFLTSYFLLLPFSGCSPADPELARIRDITSAVKPVTEAGLTLDAQATPQQVVYALLQVLKEDVRSEQDAAKRRQALHRTLALAAPGEIMARFHRKGEAQEETVLRVVRPWGAVVANYVDAFDVPTETLIAQMRVSPIDRKGSAKSGRTELQRVTLSVMDPAAPQDPSRRAILSLHLSRESDLWRVAHVGFEARPTLVPKKEAEKAPPSPTPGGDSPTSEE